MLRALLVLGAAAIALVAGASAAKPQQTTGTLDSVTPAAPAHRDTITFGYTLTGPECNKRGCALIKVWCHDAAGTLLYTADRLAADNAFYLESGTYTDGTPFWPSGTAASCTAQIGGSPATGKLIWSAWGEITFDVAASQMGCGCGKKKPKPKPAAATADAGQPRPQPGRPAVWNGEPEPKSD